MDRSDAARVVSSSGTMTCGLKRSIKPACKESIRERTLREDWADLLRKTSDCEVFVCVRLAKHTWGGAHTQRIRFGMPGKVTFASVKTRVPGDSQSLSVQGQATCPGSLSVPTTTFPSLPGRIGADW